MAETTYSFTVPNSDSNKPDWVAALKTQSYNPKTFRENKIAELQSMNKKVTVTKEINSFFQYYANQIKYELAVQPELPKWTNADELNKFYVAEKRAIDDNTDENIDAYRTDLLNLDSETGRVQKEFDSFIENIMIPGFDMKDKKRDKNAEAAAEAEIKSDEKYAKKAAKKNLPIDPATTAYNSLTGVEYFKKRIGAEIKKVCPDAEINF